MTENAGRFVAMGAQLFYLRNALADVYGCVIRYSTSAMSGMRHPYAPREPFTIGPPQRLAGR
jgi:hypothetical protein